MLILTIVELEKTECQHIRYFEVNVDEGENFNYRARVSLNAFFNIDFKRNENDKFLYVETAKRVDEKAETVKVNSLWEFYKLIGYNYKTKKYENSRQ